jgi:hypothetical protein
MHVNFSYQLIASLILFFGGALQISAQEPPPRPVEVSIVQNINFGAFSQGVSGGTVTLTPVGVRYTTGTVFLVDMGYVYFPAIFNLAGNAGTIIHPLNGPDALLTGSNGGSMTLHLGEMIPGDPIILNVMLPNYLQVRLGGTLTVGNPQASPGGYYSGTFDIMFIQE